MNNRPPDQVRRQVDVFHKEWPNSLGLVALQEVPESSPGCGACFGGASGCNPTGAACFAGSAETLFGGLHAWGHDIVVPPDWEALGFERHPIGCDYTPLCNQRFVEEALVRHRTRGWTLRFYSTHFSHRSDKLGPQIENRKEQARNLVSWVTSRAQPGELPPIVAGDFNALLSSAEDSEMLSTLRQHLDPANDIPQCHTEAGIGIDQIWVGTKVGFPSSTGTWRTVRHHGLNGTGLDMQGNTDHRSPAVSLQLLNP